MEWKDVTIEKFIALKKAMETKYETEEQKVFEVLAVLHDKPAVYFEMIPISELSELIEGSKFIYETKIKDGVPRILRVNKRVFKVETKVSDLVSGQYIDLSTLCKSEEIINQNYHKILSLFLSPVNWLGKDLFKYRISKAKTKDELIVVYDQIFKDRQEIAEYLLHNLTMDVVFQISNYFFLLYQNLILGIKDYSEREMKRTMKDLKKVLLENDFKSIGDGLLL
jgi:hypothetical protein